MRIVKRSERSRHAALAAVLVACASFGLACIGLGGGPPEGHALLESGARARVIAVDGREYYTRNIEIPAGVHDIRYKVYVRGEELHAAFRGKRVTLFCESTLYAKAGRTYRVNRTDFEKVGEEHDLEMRRSYHLYQVVIEDVETGEAVARSRVCEQA